MKKTKLIIEVQINKHRRDVTYEVDDWVWLSFRNVKTTRLQRFERQTARSLSNHCQSEYLLSSSSISQHETSAFDVQLKTTVIIFRRLSIRTAFRITQINHYWRRWTLKDRQYIELQMLSRSNTIQSQMNRFR